MQIAGRGAMEPDLQRCRLEGRTAYLNGEGLISNPYYVSRHSPPGELLQQMAWAHGWLAAEAEAVCQQAREPRELAAKVLRPPESEK